MTLKKIFFASLFIVLFPFSFSVGTAGILSKNVSIDNPQINPKDFPKSNTVKKASPKPKKPNVTVIASCGDNCKSQ